MITQKRAIELVVDIREVQEAKHKNHQHDVPEWILIIRRQLWQAELEWYAGSKSKALRKLGHISACGLAALEQLAEE